MSLPLIAAVMLVGLFFGYRLYGGFVARQYALDDSRATPATRHDDGVDFVPTRPFYLLGQHFSAIAAAGPIAGPILAAQQFGWLPALVWIAIGVVFIGAVHDLSTLVASVRHDAKSIAEVVKLQLGPGAGTAMLVFIWVALIYVIVAFTDVTASTFVQGDPELAGLTFDFHPGGAVAAASTMYLLLALLMGLVEKYVKPKLWLQTLIFVPATLGVVWLGTKLSTLVTLGPTAWGVLILGYCFVASLAPVWLLLQPRGYLGGFVLYLALAVGVIGLFFGGFDIQQPAFKGFSVGGPTGVLFPFLFVTIACGACSGFHGLVCSGTTSKQISKESHCHPVGYGAMLMEGFVAVIALATVMIISNAEMAGKGAGTIYGIGLGRFFAVVLGQQHLAFAITFGAMAFSTFVFDTLDVSTRLGRYIVQELFGWNSRAGGLVATGLTVGIPMLFLLVAEPGSWKSFWTLFGTSNQLLAALSLMGVTVWLQRLGKKYWYTLAPTIFVSAVTLTSLVLQVKAAFSPTATRVAQVNGVVAVALMALAGHLLFLGARALIPADADAGSGQLTRPEGQVEPPRPQEQRRGDLERRHCMTLIRDVIQEKSLQQVITVEPSTPLVDAAALMTRWNVGSLLVIDGDHLVGIISERDYVRSVAALGRPFAGIRVEEIMSRSVRVVPADLSTEECMGIMTHLRIRHLPVMEGDELLGVVSVGDLVKDVVNEKTFVIEQLEAYIARGANA